MGNNAWLIGVVAVLGCKSDSRPIKDCNLFWGQQSIRLTEALLGENTTGSGSEATQAWIDRQRRIKYNAQPAFAAWCSAQPPLSTCDRADWRTRAECTAAFDGLLAQRVTDAACVATLGAVAATLLALEDIGRGKTFTATVAVRLVEAERAYAGRIDPAAYSAVCAELGGFRFGCIAGGEGDDCKTLRAHLRAHLAAAAPPSP